MRDTSTPAPTAKPAYIKDLVFLFAVPAVIVLIAALAVYIPRMLARPATDFIYTACSYGCSESYFVGPTGIIQKNAVAGLSNNSYISDQEAAQLRYYDARTDATRAITYDEANRYRLDTSSRSPDGYVLTQHQASSGSFLGSDYDDSWYLKNGAKEKKIVLSGVGSNNGTEVNFIGWVVRAD